MIATLVQREFLSCLPLMPQCAPANFLRMYIQQNIHIQHIIPCSGRQQIQFSHKTSTMLPRAIPGRPVCMRSQNGVHSQIMLEWSLCIRSTSGQEAIRRPVKELHFKAFPIRPMQCNLECSKLILSLQIFNNNIGESLSGQELICNKENFRKTNLSCLFQSPPEFVSACTKLKISQISHYNCLFCQFCETYEAYYICEVCQIFEKCKTC